MGIPDVIFGDNILQYCDRLGAAQVLRFPVLEDEYGNLDVKKFDKKNEAVLEKKLAHNCFLLVRESMLKLIEVVAS